jgi:hypothetical protein
MSPDRTRTTRRRVFRRRIAMLIGGLILATGGVTALAGAPVVAAPRPAPTPGISNNPTPRHPTPSPTTPSATPSQSPSAQPSPNPQPGDGGDDPAWYDIPGQVQKAITQFIGWVATTGMKPVLAALGSTVMATPDLTHNGRVHTFWLTSLVAANAIFVLLIVAAGLVVTSHQTLQIRYGLKEVLPRLAVGALLSNTSLVLCGKAIEAANALTAAIAGQGVNGHAAANYLTDAADRGEHGDTFLLSVLAVAIIVMALVVIITFIVRMMGLVVLIGIAPLALALHALPQTEFLAYTWWRALAAVLGIQLGQAVIVVATLRVFLSPTGTSFVGLPASGSSLLDALVALSMLWLLIKLPGWTKRFVLGHQSGRGLVRQAISAILMIKTLGGMAGLARSAGTAGAARTAGAGAPRTVNQISVTNRVSISSRGATGPTPPARTPAPGPAPATARPAGSAGPASFSAAPTTQTPLTHPAGTTTAPAFSDAPGRDTPIHPSTEPGSAARPVFSDAPATQRPTPAVPGSAQPPAFSDATGTAAGTASTSPAPARGPVFSDAAVPQAAPPRPPAPTRPVFSTPPPAPPRQRRGVRPDPTRPDPKE